MKSFGLLAAAGAGVLRMKPSRTAILAATGILLVGVTRIYADYTFTTLTPPAPTDEFGAYGISGNTVVGFYNGGTYSIAGFIETGGVSSTIEDPLATRFGTAAEGVSGNTVVGWYVSGSAFQGFSETGGTYTTLTDPAAMTTAYGRTYPIGISGNTIVGTYDDAVGAHGFIERGGIYTNFDVPSALPGATGAGGIYGTTVVGTFTDALGAHGFIYDSTRLPTDPSAYTYFDDPLAAQGTDATLGGTYANGISGNTIAGYYKNATGNHGFVETNGVFTTLDDPAASTRLPNLGTYVLGIDGTTVVGMYYNNETFLQGFIATLNVPEPASLSLLVLGSLPLLVRGRSSGRDIRHGSVAP